MDIEKLVQFKGAANNLSENSPVSEYKNIVRLLGEIYKVQIAGKLTGSTTPTLATERSDAETDIAALVTEFDQLTQFFRDTVPGG
jgi:hypothetical protein